MLKAELKIGDLADNIPTVAGQSVSISESYIHPFVHSNVESVLVRSAGQWFFVVRERFQTDGNGQACSAITVISDVPVDRFQQLYQECLNWPLDFVLLEVAYRGGRLRVRADQLGSLPIYFSVKERWRSVTLSWDFADFLHESRLLDAEVLAHHLTMKACYSARQPCLGVNLLTAGAKLYVDGSETRFEYGSNGLPPSPQSLPEDVDATDEFSRILSKAVFSRASSIGRNAVELSGGMDSACVAMAISSGLWLDNMWRYPTR
ncbi:hypothetical protein [Bradyrhizobium sp. CCBAU 51745]|uniref:hypothetical protein n=1 Tax=Bradyrhizobium sp. CCBAU 51745 TaxID=1325099 RepID=UPI0023057B8E|nr:hypothetical protein [Bradyrhizobium sp. CCBAU 51745]